MERKPSKAVVVTGASTGIGRACAVHLGACGYRVFAGVRRQSDADVLSRVSAKITPVVLDITKPDDIAGAVEQVSGAGDTELVGLVNNAGIGTGGPLEFLLLDDLRHQLEVNVVGQLAVTQAFLFLLRRNRGRIINMSSISGRLATPFLGPYAGSKFCLEALMDSLRVELKPWHVEVISIQPGVISTPIWDKALNKADEILANLPEQAHRLYGPKLPEVRGQLVDASQRGIPPEAVARTVAKALSARRPRTRYLVGLDARIGALLAAILPDRLRDRLIKTI